MSTLPVRRQPRSLFPEFSELFAAFPSFSGLRPAIDTRIRELTRSPAGPQHQSRCCGPAYFTGPPPRRYLQVSEHDND
jgi:hypothetical protein